MMSSDFETSAQSTQQQHETHAKMISADLLQRLSGPEASRPGHEDRAAAETNNADSTAPLTRSRSRSRPSGRRTVARRVSQPNGRGRPRAFTAGRTTLWCLAPQAARRLMIGASLASALTVLLLCVGPTLARRAGAGSGAPVAYQVVPLADSSERQLALLRSANVELSRRSQRLQRDTAISGPGEPAPTCGYPGSPAHASVTFNTSHVVAGTAASYTCDNGYELLGPPRRICQANGTWAPVGIPFCGK